MKRTLPVLALSLVVLVVVVAASVPASGQGSDKTAAPQWFQLSVVDIQSGMAADWRKIEQEEVLPALKKAGGPGREVWTTGVFGIGSQYVIVTPIQSFAQFDGQSPMVRALGQEQAAAIGARRAKFEKGRRSYALRTRPDLSYLPDPNRAPKLALVSIVELANGRQSDFEALIKADVLPAMKKAQVKGYSVAQVVYGGSTNEVITVVAYDTFEEIGKGHPFDIALGPAGAAKLMQKSASIVTRLERHISRFVPELSFAAQRGTSTQN
ncbi:MAG: hypothetical protein ACRD1S_09950 [Vicinamibacterales bacterium]